MIAGNRNYHNPEYAQKKRKQRILRISVFFVSLCVLIGCFAGITHWSKIVIDNVIVDGPVVLSGNDIQNDVHEYILGNYFFMFGKANAILYPKEGIAQYLLKKYPRIKSIQVYLYDYRTIGVRLTERQPAALWCDTPPVESSANVTAQTASSTLTSVSTSTVVTPVVLKQTVSMDSSVIPHCYFIDTTGYVFSGAPDFSGDVYFKYYGLVPSESVVGSSYLASSDTFSQLNDFVNAVKALHITPLYIVAEDQNNFTLYIYGGGKIIFDNHDPFSKTAEHLQILLQTENLVPQKNGELLVDYIDLRYGNKLYYKVRK